jgi:hypothetical protein
LDIQFQITDKILEFDEDEDGNTIEYSKVLTI